jgi:1-acyl-sn-glycerol-3-phosphate acyltransferase
MRALLISYQVAAYYASFAFFVVLAFALNCFCLLAGLLPATDKLERFFQRLIHRNFAVFVRWLRFSGIVPVHYDGDGFSHVPARTGRVIVANHPGLMDVGWVLARVPEAVCIYKPDVGHNPLFGATARRAGYLASNRGYHMLRAAAAKLAAGHTLLVFPEGTRSSAGTLNPLKPGFVVMARVARVPIQLVRIQCDSELLTKRRPWWRVPRLPARITVSLGPCLPPPGRDTDAVVNEIEAWFRSVPSDNAFTPAPTAPVPVALRT